MDFADLALTYREVEMALQYDYRYSIKFLAGDHSEDFGAGYPLLEALLRVAAADCASNLTIWGCSVLFGWLS